jgi:hypothetical protein
MRSRSDATDSERGRRALGASAGREEGVDETRLVAARIFDAKKPRLDGELR